MKNENPNICGTAVKGLSGGHCLSGCDRLGVSTKEGSDRRGGPMDNLVPYPGQVSYHRAPLHCQKAATAPFNST